MKEHHVSIWFLIGVQLTIYGLLIGGVSVYDWLVPSAGPAVVLAQYHSGIWLGLVMLVLGLVYTKKFWPRKKSL